MRIGRRSDGLDFRFSFGGFLRLEEGFGRKRNPIRTESMRAAATMIRTKEAANPPKRRYMASKSIPVTGQG
jgi:hypothetical protein